MTCRWQAFQSELAAAHAPALAAVALTLPWQWRPGIGSRAARPVPYTVNDSRAWYWHLTGTRRVMAAPRCW